MSAARCKCLDCPPLLTSVPTEAVDMEHGEAVVRCKMPQRLLCGLIGRSASAIEWLQPAVNVVTA